VQYGTELAAAERAALAAGEVIAAHYAKGEIAVDTKSDQSPVTQADRDANAVIVELLRAAFPDDTILSEELPDDLARLGRHRVWIVDPLDGTRDFVARTGQFSVHVALAVDGAAVVGAVYQPVAKVLYSAAAGGGAWRVEPDVDKRTRLHVSDVAAPQWSKIGTSRLNATSRISEFLAATGLRDNAVPMGASVKHMAVAAGELDAAINLSPGETEWDTCAPEVVIREAGGAFTDGDGAPFRYNQRDVNHYRGSLASNGVTHAAWVELLRSHLVADTR
jgi:3'(2'), 5'-bisphosphate nucleotidase